MKFPVALLIFALVAAQDSCRCPESTYLDVEWPQSPCNQKITVSCSGNEEETVSRLCTDDGVWASDVEGVCTCPQKSEWGIHWRKTDGGESYKARCDVNTGYGLGYERQCKGNGVWASDRTGECFCTPQDAFEFSWPMTPGGETAEVRCDLLAHGSMSRACGMLGNWGPDIAGECRCPENQLYGYVWQEAQVGETQSMTCAAGAIGTGMTRTCNSKGVWGDVIGRCQCPEFTDSISGLFFPTTVSGNRMAHTCASKGEGEIAYEATCLNGGVWSSMIQGHCTCPEEVFVSPGKSEYPFPQTEGGDEVEMPCAELQDMNITRTCTLLGRWQHPVGCDEELFCPAEVFHELQFDETEAGTMRMVACRGEGSSSYGRMCNESGEWSNDLMGFCTCESFTDDEEIVWPTIIAHESITMPCATGYEGTSERSCSLLGEWSPATSTCVRLSCADDYFMGMSWGNTLSKESSYVACQDPVLSDEVGWTRQCQADGTWAMDPVGLCRCEGMVDAEGKVWPATLANEYHHFDCPNGYVGSVNRRCHAQGYWTDERDDCERMSCPAENFEGYEWPKTEAGLLATIKCKSSAEIFHHRLCNNYGEWEDDVTGDEPCKCDMELTVIDREVYKWDIAVANTTVERACQGKAVGVVRNTCGVEGLWENLESECVQLMCPSENDKFGVFWQNTLTNTTSHISCAPGGSGPGFDRYCDDVGVWSELISGSCSCEESQVLHTDGVTYTFGKTGYSTTVQAECPIGLFGKVTRRCDPYGAWQAVAGECLRLSCNEELLDGYLWPMTLSNSKATLDCQGMMSGTVERECVTSGVWGAVIDNCYQTECADVVATHTADAGCMNFQYAFPEVAEGDEDLPQKFAHVTLIPSAQDEVTMVTKENNVTFCGLQPNVAYTLYIKFSEEAKLTDYADTCVKRSIHYQQHCQQMQPVSIVSQQEDDTRTLVKSIVVSAEFPKCPLPAVEYEIEYYCKSCVGEGDTDHVIIATGCDQLDGCQASTRRSVMISDDMMKGEVYVFVQRVKLVATPEEGEDQDPKADESEKAFTFVSSPEVEIMMGAVAAISPMVIESQNTNTKSVTIRLTGPHLAFYRQHTIDVHQLVAAGGAPVGAVRTSILTLCGTCNDGCIATCIPTPVHLELENGFAYEVTVTSMPISGTLNPKTSTKVIHTYNEPPYEVTATAGDNYISLLFTDSVMSLTGRCNFIATGNLAAGNKIVEVSYPASRAEHSVVVSGLAMDTTYRVSCVMRDSINKERRVIVDTQTTKMTNPVVTLSLVADTIYDVEVGVVINKPVTLRCLSMPSTTTISLSMLNTSPNAYVLDNVKGKSKIIVPHTEPHRTAIFTVYCYATDSFLNGVLESLRVVASGIEEAPELLEPVPAIGEENVKPSTEVQLVFKRPVVMKTDIFSFFILTEVGTGSTFQGASAIRALAENDVVSYQLPAATSARVVKNSVFITLPQLKSNVRYQLTMSNEKLLTDASSGLPFSLDTGLLADFTSQTYDPIVGNMVVPDEGAKFAVDGIIEIEFNGFLTIREGAIKLNVLEVDAKNVCIELLHPSATSTLLRIPVIDCVGVLLPNHAYVLTVPEGFLENKEGLRSDKVSSYFISEDVTILPKIIYSNPPHLEDLVPIDVPIKLFFNQQVVMGDGYVFLADDEGTTYNLPIAKADFGNTFPYEVSWNSLYYTLNPRKKYTMTWSEGFVRNFAGDLIKQSAETSEIVFNTGSVMCSPDYMSKRISEAFVCRYEAGVCQCNTSTLTAATFKNKK